MDLELSHHQELSNRNLQICLGRFLGQALSKNKSFILTEGFKSAVKAFIRQTKKPLTGFIKDILKSNIPGIIDKIRDGIFSFAQSVFSDKCIT